MFLTGRSSFMTPEFINVSFSNEILLTKTLEDFSNDLPNEANIGRE